MKLLGDSVIHGYLATLLQLRVQYLYPRRGLHSAARLEL